MENKKTWKLLNLQVQTFTFMITFTLCILMGDAQRQGTFPNWGLSLIEGPILGPLFWEWPHTGDLTCTYNPAESWIPSFVLGVVQCWRHILLRATLDEGPMSRDQWIQTILLVESFKLVPRPLDEGPIPKSGKLRLNLHGTCFEGKINWFSRKQSAKRRAPHLKNQESV
jgi:hypothetical protein